MPRTITISDEAYRALCGLVQPSDIVDADEVYTSDHTWDEIRAAFPLSDYHPLAEDDDNAGT